MSAPPTGRIDTREKLLLADDDPTFCHVLAGALTRRGFRVSVAHDVDAAIRAAKRTTPAYAVVDLRMPGRSGLELVRALVELDPEMRIVVLTGYASIATAVEAVKLGATHYLAKPADADEVVAAFGRRDGDPLVAVPDRSLSVDRLAWEYIQKALAECDGNVSAAARRLGMHRRTLQRKLKRHPGD
jgi:two-component system response regulator RegA